MGICGTLSDPKEDAPQWKYSLREVFNGLRYIARTGMQWRMMANNLPPWHTVYQQTQRWLKAGVFEDMVRDLRMLMREIEGRPPQPRAAIVDSRALQSSPESGGACRLRWTQAPQGLQGAPGCGYPGPVADALGHPC